MMRRAMRLVALGAASLACSGRYYEVGGMDATAGGTAGVGGNRGAAGGAAPGGTANPGPSDAGPAMSAGGGGPVGEFGPQCVEQGAPPQLAGTFAAPKVVWDRIAMLTWGKRVAPPNGLPSSTTYTWAGDVAKAEMSHAEDALGTVPGVDLVLRQWLGLDARAELLLTWGSEVSMFDPILPALLQTPFDYQQRHGIFTEPSWLALNPNISTRGLNIERALFNLEVPPPPGGVAKPPPDLGMPDRLALETATADPRCLSCHQMFDQTGFALGHFDANGSYRELDHGLPIDVTGSRQVNQGSRTIDFDGIADFGEKFSGNCEATLGLAHRLLRAALVVNEVPEATRGEVYEANKARFEQAFVNGGRSYRALVTAYIQSPVGLRP